MTNNQKAMRGIQFHGLKPKVARRVAKRMGYCDKFASKHQANLRAAGVRVAHRKKAAGRMRKAEETTDRDRADAMMMEDWP